MQVDVNTLYYLIGGTSFAGAALTLWQRRLGAAHRRVLASWAAGHCLVGIGCLLRLFHGALPPFVSIGASNLSVLAGYAAVTAGTVRFARGRLPAALPVGAAVVAATWLVWGQYASIETRIVATGSITAALAFQAAVALRARGGSTPLAAQRLMQATFALHGLFFLGRAGVTLAGLEGGGIAFTGWNFAATMIEGILWSAFAPAALLLMVRETTERSLVAASETDFLTGIDNRRAFTTKAARLFAAGTPSSLAVFDLDHFKTINDRHGHAVGDEVLRRFCRTVEAALSPGDVFGRLGGEEFAVAFRGCRAEEARRRAAAISGCYTAEVATRFALSLRATVSAGVAEGGRGSELGRLLGEADGALYRAKRAGRDRTLIAAAATAADAPDPDAGPAVWAA